jgi:serine/threonine protein kinase
MPPLLPVLKDFGLSFSPENDGYPLSDNPEDNVFNDDLLAYPPELQRQRPFNLIPLGEATDIWGVGSIARTLIVNRHTNHPPVFDERDDGNLIYMSVRHPEDLLKVNSGRTLMGGKGFSAAANYSEELKDMVRKCLKFDVEARLTLREIYSTASRKLEEPGMMDMVMDWENFGLSLPSDRDEFRVDKAFVVAKHRPKEGAAKDGQVTISIIAQ